MIAPACSAAPNASFLQEVLAPWPDWNSRHEAAHLQVSFRKACRKLLKTLKAWRDRTTANEFNVFLSGSWQLSTSLQPELLQQQFVVLEGLAELAAWEAMTEPSPVLAKTKFTPLNMAMKVAVLGPDRFVEVIEARWSLRHDVDSKPAGSDERPRKRLAADRLRWALMRFVFGFFGSHKVDARNNP